MWGWIGELASAFSASGLQGLVLLTLLIVAVLLIRANGKKDEHLRNMHNSTIQALDRSSDAHHGVSRVLGRIEGMLRLPPEKD